MRIDTYVNILPIKRGVIICRVQKISVTKIISITQFQVSKLPCNCCNLQKP